MLLAKQRNVNPPGVSSNILLMTAQLHPTIVLLDTFLPLC